MKIVLLFVFLLFSVCEGKDDGDKDFHACLGGWFEFSCKHAKNKENILLNVDAPNGRKINNKKIGQNEWTALDEQRSVYYDTAAGKFRVVMKQLNNNDVGDYECKKGLRGEAELKKVLPTCSMNTSITAYTPRVNASIPCDWSTNFVCKENKTHCEILPWKIPYTIHGVRVEDGGVYWCGYTKKDYNVSTEKIYFHAVETSMKKATSGQDFSHHFAHGDNSQKISVCKGDDLTVCTPLSATSGRITFGRKHQMVLTNISNVIADDAGSYWFGSLSTDGVKNIYFHKLTLTVTTLPRFTTTHYPDTTKKLPRPDNTSNTQFTPSPWHQGALWKTLVIVAAVFGVILLLALTAIIVHKRFHGFGKKTLHEVNHEDHHYEEIQGAPLQSSPGTALNTIYATASAPVVLDLNKNQPNQDAIVKDNVLYSTTDTT